MNIGSNNALTYLKPISFWFKVFNFLVKKQNRTYSEQYKHGNARYFNILSMYITALSSRKETVFSEHSQFMMLSHFSIEWKILQWK